MSAKTYRAAILGIGGMGSTHAKTLLKAADVELVALCSVPENGAKAYAEKNGLSAAIYSDGKKMIQNEKPDLLYICLPPFAHDGQLEMAAGQGAHIFVEKPIAINAERAKSMAEAVKKAGVRSQVGYHMRFGYAVSQLKEKIDSGAAGLPTLYTAHYECNSLHSPWWIDVNKCGGQVFEQVIHLYDMAMYLMGQPEAVSGYIANLTHRGTPGYTVEDTSVSAIRFANGSLGSITGSNCAVPGRWSAMFRVVFSSLVADFTDPNNAKFIYTAEKNREEIVTGGNLMYQLEDEYFLDVVRGRKPEFAPVAEGFAGLKMVSGVVASALSGGNFVDIR
jgi:predicted dehydrogenase